MKLNNFIKSIDFKFNNDNFNIFNVNTHNNGNYLFKLKFNCITIHKTYKNP